MSYCKLSGDGKIWSIWNVIIFAQPYSRQGTLSIKVVQSIVAMRHKSILAYLCDEIIHLMKEEEFWWEVEINLGITIYNIIMPGKDHYLTQYE